MQTQLLTIPQSTCLEQEIVRKAQSTGTYGSRGDNKQPNECNSFAS
jgi:hypothetical protein